MTGQNSVFLRTMSVKSHLVPLMNWKDQLKVSEAQRDVIF